MVEIAAELQWVAGAAFAISFVKNGVSIFKGLNGKSGQQCKDDPRFQSHVTEAHDSLECMKRMEAAMKVIETHIPAQTVLLQTIVKNGHGKN